MKLSDLYPYVVPHVPDMPLPSVDLHIRMAAREFFERTHAWSVSLDTFTYLDGKTQYDLGGPNGADVVKVQEVEANEGDYSKAVTFVDGLTLVFDPNAAPQNNAVVSTTVALAPRVGDLAKTWSLPAELDRFVTDIAPGALANALATIDGKENKAAMHRTMFKDAMLTVGIQASRAWTAKRLTKRSTLQMY
jgi:hypothetical protein